jgi:FKBP-type peptidyl-prolyl cis-trans isomerase FklB
MKIFKQVPVLAMGALLLVGCSQENEVKLDNHVDQASYGVGLNIGESLARDAVELNVDAIAAGISDALSGAEKRIDQETLQAAFEKIREEQELKQAALNDSAAQEGANFLAENGKKEGVTTLESGLQYEVITAAAEAGAKPAATDTVSVHYHGTLSDGSVFDSSVERGTPAEFPVNRVIAGWTEALQLMSVGDKWKLYIPADLAYGAQSPSPKIPANSALVFEVELLDVKQEG